MFSTTEILDDESIEFLFKSFFSSISTDFLSKDLKIIGPEPTPKFHVVSEKESKERSLFYPYCKLFD